jgi:hypothetical protein
MSVAATSIGETPLAAAVQPAAKQRTPPRRKAVAKLDTVAQPEPR